MPSNQLAFVDHVCLLLESILRSHDIISQLVQLPPTRYISIHCFVAFSILCLISVYYICLRILTLYCISCSSHCCFFGSKLLLKSLKSTIIIIDCTSFLILPTMHLYFSVVVFGLVVTLIWHPLYCFVSLLESQLIYVLVTFLALLGILSTFHLCLFCHIVSNFLNILVRT